MLQGMHVRPAVARPRGPSCFVAGLIACLALLAVPVQAAEEVLPKHITPATLKAVRAGLDFLARTQDADGSWHSDDGGEAYPVAMTGLAGMALLANGNSSTRGRYAPQVEKAVDYLMNCSTESGLITGPTQENGRPMHGHGFALMFLSCAYGSETKPARRDRIKAVIEKAIKLTSEGQSSEGGWYYTPGSPFDEGSVTVTQVQALRAAHNAGLAVPRGTISEAVNYIERCGTSDGGISYSLRYNDGPRLPISAAAVATLYNAGQYDAPVANRCLEYVWRNFENSKSWGKSGGHVFYCHLYAAQAFYMAGDKYWDAYFPGARDQLLALQSKGEGSWTGDGIGKSYGTSIALVILQLPYKYLPVYQR
ncbi:MAG: prenyltransferase/squalene oxidase repeat-containing protein [Pirellulales bacterium]